jgi:SAM-dependent methyltransferase
MIERPGLFPWLKNTLLGPAGRSHWCRTVMDAETATLVRALDPSRLDALEISGDKWMRFGFQSYLAVHYPEFDICSPTLDRRYDIVIAEQVLEHVLTPYRAVRAMHDLLTPGGYCLITTPFLIRVHAGPHDCTRWTATGLKYFLAECGFPLDRIHADMWGNRACAIANLYRFVAYRPRVHSLKNEPDFPVAVWALAQRD